MPFLLALLESLGATAIKDLFARWFTKNPEVETLHAELDAKTKEAQALAAPARDKQSVIDSMRSRVE